VALNTPLFIIVSNGPGTVAIPQVNGQDCTDYLNTLSAAQLVPTENFSYSTTIPQNQVISSNPSAGTAVNLKSGVTVTCSSGQPTQTAPPTAPGSPTPTPTLGF